MNHYRPEPQRGQSPATSNRILETSYAVGRILTQQSPRSAGGVARAPQRGPVAGDTTIRCDGDKARIVFGLKDLPHLQRYLPLHQLARETQRQGFTRLEFDSALRRYGVQGCEAYNSRLLRSGDGFWWNIDPRTGMIYPCGYVSLCNRLVERATEIGLIDLYSTNTPGEKRDMYIDVSGTAANFEAAVLNAWIAGKNNPTISREVMRRLFNRDDRALRHIEKRAGIQVIHNEAETYDPADVPLNDRGDLRSDVYRTKDAFGRIIWHYRLPNTYISTICKQHIARGQGRAASYTVRDWFRTNELPGTSEQGLCSPGKLKQVGRLYCETDKGAKRSHSNGNVNTIHVPVEHGRAGIIRYKAINHYVSYR